MKYIALSILTMGIFLTSCSDDLDLKIPYPDNITFEELTLPGRFTHEVPDKGFSVRGLNFNTVKSADGQLESGFCYSNRSNRSFVWSNTSEALDSIRYSVWSTRPNNTGTYLVCHPKNDNAFFTLDKAQVIDYMLVSNTTWVYLAYIIHTIGYNANSIRSILHISSFTI